MAKTRVLIISKSRFLRTNFHKLTFFCPEITKRRSSSRKNAYL